MFAIEATIRRRQGNNGADFWDKWFAKWVELKAKSVKPPITEEEAYLALRVCGIAGE